MASECKQNRKCIPAVIRPMEMSDLQDVYAIEVAAYPRPWPIKCFIDEMNKNRFARYVVAGDGGGTILGYLGMWIISGEAHITNVAVDPPFQRRKVAEQLLVNSLEYALAHRCNSIYLEVRRYNIAAQRLYTRYRFMPTRIRERYYQDNNEDAIELRIPDMWDEKFLAAFRHHRGRLLDALGLDRFPGADIVT